MRFVLAAAAALCAAPASAATVVLAPDEVFAPRAFQLKTTGQSQIVSIEAKLEKPGSLVIDWRPFGNEYQGVPSPVLTGLDADTWYRFDFPILIPENTTYPPNSNLNWEMLIRGIYAREENPRAFNGLSIRNVTLYVGPTPPEPPRLTSVSGIPEPATWAMMIVGFGAVGAMSRARRQVRSSTHDQSRYSSIR